MLGVPVRGRAGGRGVAALAEAPARGAPRYRVRRAPSSRGVLCGGCDNGVLPRERSGPGPRAAHAPRPRARCPRPSPPRRRSGNRTTSPRGQRARPRRSTPGPVVRAGGAGRAGSCSQGITEWRDAGIAEGGKELRDSGSNPHLSPSPQL